MERAALIGELQQEQRRSLGVKVGAESSHSRTSSRQIGLTSS
jgi:hypothetical protein